MNRKERQAIFDNIKNSDPKYSHNDKKIINVMTILGIIFKTIIITILAILVLIGIISLVNEQTRNDLITYIWGKK